MTQHRKSYVLGYRRKLLALAVFGALMATLIAIGSTPARSAPGDTVLGELEVAPVEGPLYTVLEYTTSGACPAGADRAFARLLGPGIDSTYGGYTGLFPAYEGNVTGGAFSQQARLGLSAAQVELGIVFDGVYELRVSCGYPLGHSGAQPPFGDFVTTLTITPSGGDLGEFAVGGEEPIQDFPDVPPSHQFYADIMWLVEQVPPITTGYDDGEFKPANPVTRMAMAAFLYRFSGEPNGPNPTCTVAPFPDVLASHQFCGEIEWLVDEGITEGFEDGEFKPNAQITRQAMAAFLWRLQGEPAPAPGAPTFPDVPPGHPFHTPISWLAQEGITTGFDDGEFKPGNNVTRQAMAAFLHRLAVPAS